MAITLSKSSLHHAEYDEFQARWRMIRDVLSGKDDIDEAGVTYLPQPNSYSAERYTAYQVRAVLYNATARTLEGYLGAIFRKQADVELPKELEYLLTDTDGAGNNLTQFSKRVARDVIAMGRHGVLVDYPSVKGGRTLAEERADGLKAQLMSYTPESIVNWHTTRVGTQTILTHVLLEEDCSTSGNHVFNDTAFKQWRMLQLVNGVFEQHVLRTRKTKDPKTGDEITEYVTYSKVTPTLPDGNTLNYIPFIFIGSETFSPCPDRPPLYDLSQLNIAHYRNSADWEQAVFMIGQPTPWISGLDDGFIEDNKGQLVIGSSACLLLPDGAVAGMLEPKAPRNLIKEAMEFKENEMIGLGARIIQDNSARGSESTESVQVRRSGEASQLTCIADNVSQALVKCFEWAAAYMGVPDAEIKYQLNKDFFAQRLGHQDIASLVSAWQSGAIPQDTLFNNLRKGEIISELVSNEELKGQLESEGIPLGMMEDTPTTQPALEQEEELDATDNSEPSDI